MNFTSSARVGLRWTRLSLGLEGRLDLPVNESVPARGDTIEYSSQRLSFVPCLRLWFVGLCGVISGGWIHLLRAGADGQAAHLQGWAGARVEAEWLFVRSPRVSFGLRAHLEGAAGFTRPGLSDETRRDFWVAPTVSASAGASILVVVR